MRDQLAQWDPVVLAAVAVGLAVLGLLILIFGYRRRRPDMMSLFGGAAKAIPSRWDSAPVDLSKPIRGEEAWTAILAASTDEAYLRAAEMVRKRFAEGHPPMRLSVLLRSTMDREAINFREAMIRVAEMPDADLR